MCSPLPTPVLCQGLGTMAIVRGQYPAWWEGVLGEGGGSGLSPTL